MNLDDALRTLQIAASIQQAVKDVGLASPAEAHRTGSTLIATPAIEMDAEDIAQAHAVIDIIKQRLRKLERKRATYGINFPAEDQIDWDNLQAEKQELEQKLRAAKAT